MSNMLCQREIQFSRPDHRILKDCSQEGKWAVAENSELPLEKSWTKI